MKNIVIDSHCDTALKLLNGSYINDMNNQFTLDNALKYDKYIQFFAMYIEPDNIINGEYDLCIRLIDNTKNEIRNNNEYISIITNKEQLKNYFIEEDKKVGVIFSVEDASCLEGKIENLQKLFNMGIRVIGLTWNGKNQVATGVDYSDTNEDGLTQFGKEVIKKMNELGIIIDVSHLSEKSFYDVMKITQKPVMASHSCSKYICNHKRNLTDEQIKLIVDGGGIIGVNFYKDFISKDINKANIECLVKHIRHIYNIGGKECVGLGSDYDGIKADSIVTGLENNLKLIKLIDCLKEKKFTDDDIERIMWRNHYEFLIKELK